MYELFFKKFNEKVPLVLKEQEFIKLFLTPKKLRKNQYLLQEEDVCRSIAFVERGALKEYSVDEDGKEQFIQFAPEGWTISDLYSFLTREPASYNINAVEDAELFLINEATHEELLGRLPKYETYIRLQVSKKGLKK